MIDSLILAGLLAASPGLAQTLLGAALTSAPQPRFGAAAHYAHDIGAIVFIGGIGGSWNTQTALPLEQSVVALSLSRPFNAAVAAPAPVVVAPVPTSVNGTRPVQTTQPTQPTQPTTQNYPQWLFVPTARLTAPNSQNTSAGATTIDPRFTSYPVAVTARSTDLGLGSGAPVDLLFNTFGNSPNPSSSAVYQYTPSAASVITQYVSPAFSASARVRAAYCLLDPTTILIHGGSDGPDNGASTVTLGSTYFLDLKGLVKGTNQRPWVLKSTGNDKDPLLHDHSMVCIAGTAYMVGGIKDGLKSDGTMIGNPLTSIFVYTYPNGDVTGGGSWQQVSVNPDPSNGYPLPRRSATLTAVDPSSNILLYHGGVAPDISTTYSDLWQLDVTSLSWKLLSPAPIARHSHNAVAINGYLLVAFGVISNFSDPNPPVPSILTYDIQKDVWSSTFPIAVTPTQPPQIPTKVVVATPASTATSSTSGDTVLLGLPAPVFYGIAGGIGGLVLIALATWFCCWHRRRSREPTQKAEDEQQRMAERLHHEDTDARGALEGIIGTGLKVGEGREVGGQLGRVIRMNQTGVVSADDLEEKRLPAEPYSRNGHDVYDDEETEEEERGVFKFGVRVGLKETDGGGPMTNGKRASYASGLSYPSGSGGFSEFDEDETDDDGSTTGLGSSAYSSQVSLNELGKRMSSGGRKSAGGGSQTPNPLVARDEPLRPWELPGMGTLTKPVPAATVNGKDSRLSFGAVGGSHRALSPLAQGPVFSVGDEIRQRTSQHSLDYGGTPLGGASPIPLSGPVEDLALTRRPRRTAGSAPTSPPQQYQQLSSPLQQYQSMTPPQQYLAQPSQDSRSELALIADSIRSSGSEVSLPMLQQHRSNGHRRSFRTSLQSSPLVQQQQQPAFDEQEYMRGLFLQFTDEEILNSWNSYVNYTGQVYTLAQISALRTIYGPSAVTKTTSSSGSPDSEE
ncbi:hypothetical protein HDU99_003798 [Rhizoclosmatium hyalinum]|nr:hypothetical protein HDU99_003798 [Rhizoclosmatium hyalinum]